MEQIEKEVWVCLSRKPGIDRFLGVWSSEPSEYNKNNPEFEFLLGRLIYPIYVAEKSNNATIMEEMGEIEKKTIELKKMVYTPEELKKEQEQVDFIEANINWLRDYHSKFAKTDDPDEFDNWMGEEDNERLIEIIKNEQKKATNK